MRLSTIVATGGLGLSVAAFLGRLTQPFELLSQFRVQYIVLGLVLFTWSAVARERPTAIVAACMLGLNLGVVAVVASQVASQVAPASEAAGPRLVWANLYRKPEVLTTLASQTKGADIVALTEVPANGLVRIRAAFPGFQCVLFDDDRGNPFAVAIVARKACPSHDEGIDVRYADIDGLRVVAVHARPPWDNARTAARNAAIRRAFTLASAAPRGLLVGDFNATPWSPAFTGKTMAELRRARCGWPGQPTWLGSGPVLGLVLDQVFVTPRLGVVHCSIGGDIGSDHRPLSLTLTPQ